MHKWVISFGVSGYFSHVNNLDQDQPRKIHQPDRDLDRLSVRSHSKIIYEEYHS